jgi:hypothetical protein
MKKLLLYSYVVLLFIIATVILWPDLASAQPSPLAEPQQTPIDGGFGLLAAAGGVYAIKKLRD